MLLMGGAYTTQRHAREELRQQLQALPLVTLQQALREACNRHRHAEVSCLLSLTGAAGMAVHQGVEGAFRAACKSGNVWAAQRLLEDGGGGALAPHVVHDEFFRACCMGNRNTAILPLLTAIQCGPYRVTTQPLLTRAFVRACQYNDMNTVRWLLSFKGDAAVDVATGDNVVFRTACAKGFSDLVYLLTSLRGERSLQPDSDLILEGFRQAAESGHLHVVWRLKFMLSPERARAAAEAALPTALLGGHADTADLLMNMADKVAGRLPPALTWRALLRACETGRPRMAELLLRRRLVSPGRHDRKEALTTALVAKAASVLEVLLKAGWADDHTLVLEVQAPLEDAFSQACREGDTDMVKALLPHEGIPDLGLHSQCQKGFQEACRWGHAGVVRALLGEGEETWKHAVNVNAQDDLAIREACRYGHYGVAWALLHLPRARSVNPLACNREAFEFAKRHRPILDMLETWLWTRMPECDRVD